MSPRDRGTFAYPEMADELERWARARNVENDPYVIGLSDGLRSGKELGFWALHAPMDWLPRPRSTIASRLGSWARLIAITRNVLIFLPVALTWFAIGQATRAFDAYLNAGAETTANFLEFWQDGKGLLDEKWRIGNVATLDFQIIMVLILLSFLSGLLQARSLKLANQDYNVFEKERIDMSLKIDTILNPYRAVSDNSLSRTLALLLERLERVSKSLDNVGRDMVKASGTLDPKMKKSLLEIEKSATSVKKAAVQVQRSSVSAEKAAKRLSSKSQVKRK